MVSVMLGPPEDVDLDGPTLVALANLADLGMVPHLRLVDGDGMTPGSGHSEAARQASG